MSKSLNWPLEAASASESDQRWVQPESNICLDFHGDPINAGLVVFSDGNHHMALEACLQLFLRQHPQIMDIFYATTPPSVIVNYLNHGRMVLGNLTLSRLPNIFISPIGIMKQLQTDGYVPSYQAFMQSRGNVLLVRKGNTKAIQSIADLLRDDVRLFISNPITEKASHVVYAQSLLSLAEENGLDLNTVQNLLNGSSNRLVTGNRIHHREAPQCLYENNADVAIIYYHLALRYSRIFPDDFAIVPMTKTQGLGLKGEADYSKNNQTTDYHIGLVDDGAEWGKTFLEFMFSDEVTTIYAAHGLQRP
ncbi:MAG: substrate-binding domain-containing protein [Gammaproteobacteria bacterium]|nr:substrate-binding domain-containing protein [Gammaproteobacteria bacterium]MDH5729580.1 substrate-binding domain-containing protein [Gammaproteobacteria bacterium]